MHKRLIVLLAILFVVIAGSFIYWKFASKTVDTPPPANEQAVVLEKPLKSDVPTEKLPEKFPTNIPIEAGAKITQNYNTTSPDGSIQATRVFETKATLAENLALYKRYLSNNGYEIRSTIDQISYKMVIGANDDGTVQVSINQNSVTNIKTVSINYTQKSKVAPSQPQTQPQSKVPAPAPISPNN